MVMADELYMFSVGDEIPVDNIETNVSEKEFTCSQCSETFEDRSTLFKHVHVRHKQHVHSRRKFKCDRCEKIFKSMTGLRNHVRTHPDFFVLQVDTTQNTSNISPSKQPATDDDSDTVLVRSSIDEEVFDNVLEKTNVREIMNSNDKLTDVNAEENKLENNTSETENGNFSDNISVNSECITVLSNSRKSERRRSGIPVPIGRSLYVEHDSRSPQGNEKSHRNEMTGQNKCPTSSAHNKRERSLSKSLRQSPFGKKFKTKAQCPQTPSRSKSALNLEQNASPLRKRNLTPKSAGKCTISNGKNRSTPKQLTPRNIFASNSAKKYKIDGDMFICKKCGKSFIDRAKLNVHFAIHSRDTPEKCGIEKRLVKRNITNQISAGSPFGDAVTAQIFSCQKCKQKFENEALLDKHMKSHDVKTHHCPYCDKQFRFQSSLKAHSFVHQGETLGHVTEVGNKDRVPDIKTLSMETSSYIEDNFNTFSLMPTNSCTNDYLPFACKSCNYSTHLPAELLSHMKTHSRTGPYTCSHCKKSYRQQSNLQVHQKIHTISKIKNIIVTNRRMKERA